VLLDDVMKISYSSKIPIFIVWKRRTWTNFFEFFLLQKYQQ